jgi:hypothetical protein
MSRQFAPENPVLAVDDVDGKGSDEAVIETPVVAPASYNEPVVSRKELWAYYRMLYPLSVLERS